MIHEPFHKLLRSIKVCVNLKGLTQTLIEFGQLRLLNLNIATQLQIFFCLLFLPRFEIDSKNALIFIRLLVTREMDSYKRALI